VTFIRRPVVVLAVICLAAFTAILDTSVVGLMLPLIGRDLHAGVAELAWVANAYVLTYAVLLASAGVLGDRFGRKRVFIIGLALFGIGSVVCALAPSIGWLLAGRVVQGAGAAAMLTLALAQISVAFPERRPWAMGIFVLFGSLGGVAGPLAGAALATIGGWRFIFWNLAVVATLAMVAAGAVLVGSRGAPRHLDLPGLSLISASLVALNLGLLEGATWGWLSLATLAAFAVAAASLASFALWERVCGEPMVRLKTFANASFLGNTLAGACGWFFALAVVIYTSIYLQSEHGLGVLAAGLVLATWGLVSAVAGLTVERAARLVGTETLLVGALAAMALVLAPWVLAASNWPVWLLVVLMALMGAPFAYVIALSAAGAFTGFAPSEAGLAAATFNTARQIGSSLGIALPAAALSTVLNGRSLAPGVVGLAGALDAAFTVRVVVVVAATIAIALLFRRARVVLHSTT
jgi:MFS family permease